MGTYFSFFLVLGVDVQYVGNYLLFLFLLMLFFLFVFFFSETIKRVL